jgi:SAM-dependent methyltransferase
MRNRKSDTPGREIDLLANYPRSNRNVDTRGAEKTEADQAVARRFGKEFFDGDRRHGYGGFTYHPRFWQPVVPTFRDYYSLTGESAVLDVGCAKGFMVRDLKELIPGISVNGIDISDYAIGCAEEDISDDLTVADAKELPFDDASFDLVVSINTIHNLDREGVVQALGEIERVSRSFSYVTVDAYRNEEERERMMKWNLTARTILSDSEWVGLFAEAGYKGDYYWFVP